MVNFVHRFGLILFIQNKSLSNLLPPSAYWDASLFQEEQEFLRKKSWYWGCLKTDIDEHTQYCCKTVAGVPVVIWNHNGKLRAFKNVCLHRHSKISKNGCGKATTLVCQYHGWEFGPNGKIVNIPDAGNFGKMELPTRCLEEFPVEIVGDSVVLALNQSAPSFRGSLGEISEELDTHFEGRNLFFQEVVDLRVNWKLIVENFIETYHIPNVHGRNQKNHIFKNYAPEELCDHVLETCYTRYADLRPWEGEFVGQLYIFLARLMRSIRAPRRFIVTHVFPNFIFYYSDLFSVFFYIDAIGPEQSRVHTYFYDSKPVAWPSILKPVQFLMEFAMKISFRRVLKEDYLLLSEIQAGIRHAESKAVLSRREERIFSFQRYLKEYS